MARSCVLACVKRLALAMFATLAFAVACTSSSPDDHSGSTPTPVASGGSSLPPLTPPPATGAHLPGIDQTVCDVTSTRVDLGLSESGLDRAYAFSRSRASGCKSSRAFVAIAPHGPTSSRSRPRRPCAVIAGSSRPPTLTTTASPRLRSVSAGSMRTSTSSMSSTIRVRRWNQFTTRKEGLCPWLLVEARRACSVSSADPVGS
jgi:hypothetical protein